METKYFRLNYNEAVSGKKDILSSKINIINLMSRYGNLKRVKREEFNLKRELKAEISSLKQKMEFLKAHFPEEEFKPIFEKKEKRIKKVKEKKGKKERKDLRDELEEIKAKLAKLE